MIRALYISAAGMMAQQKHTDIISENISNANTPGYRSSRPSFSDALYTSLDKRREKEKINLQSGNGVRVGLQQVMFKQGSLDTTSNPLDFAIDGDGFFMVQGQNGDTLYTRHGGFNLSHMGGGVFRLADRSGNAVLDEYGNTIEFVGDPGELILEQDGTLNIKDDQGRLIPQAKLGIRIFVNPQGLTSMGGVYFAETSESGAPRSSGRGNVMQGFLENSNVELYKEMTQLIMAQRAYQINSRVLQSADEMERLANNLRG